MGIRGRDSKGAQGNCWEVVDVFYYLDCGDGFSTYVKTVQMSFLRMPSII